MKKRPQRKGNLECKNKEKLTTIKKPLRRTSEDIQIKMK